MEINTMTDTIKLLKTKKLTPNNLFVYCMDAGFSVVKSCEIVRSIHNNDVKINLDDNSIIHYVKKFEHVCALLNINIDKFNKETSTLTKPDLAQFKLTLIALVLNNGWSPDFKNENEQKWYPWFKLDKQNGCVFTTLFTLVGL